jgi:tRNA threonylcarbamoyladenosine biosynthesis protein TsaB
LSYLFIDSTYELTLGVLDDDFKWLSFEKLTGHKASAIIQKKSHELLEQHKIAAQDLTGIIIVNGPGFYTGLRLAEGFADVFNFFGVPQFSLYSYEVPLWCGFESGTWFTKAYRGEYFFHHWSSTKSTQELLSAKEIEEALKDKKLFIHSEASLDKLGLEFVKEYISTHELLCNNPDKIFPHVIKGQKKEAFYFRAPEDEFKANP